ncbi:MAG TPA: DUF2807 domain-containing protein [Fulvivirga sp.]|nr:DUF2807 domain-containing protein [Fulvivirga sp.]
MVRLTTSLIALLICTGSFAQTIERDLDTFNKLIVDPFINVELIAGDQEHIEITYDNIDPELINADLRGKTLHLYLDYAKINWRLMHRDFHMPRKYEYASVNVKVTYKSLKKIQMRGEEKLVCNSSLTGKKLKLKVYGENNIELADVASKKFKASLFGDNELLVSGTTTNQIFNTFGDNTIKASKLEGRNVKTTGFGASHIDISVADYLRVVQFGEGSVSYSGDPVIGRKLLIGETELRRVK